MDTCSDCYREHISTYFNANYWGGGFTISIYSVQYKPQKIRVSLLGRVVWSLLQGVMHPLAGLIRVLLLMQFTNQSSAKI